MRKTFIAGLLTVCLGVFLCACASAAQADSAIQPEGEETMHDPYTTDTKITDVINDPAFGEYGRLIFPVNEGYYSGDTLGQLQLSNPNPNQSFPPQTRL